MAEERVERRLAAILCADVAGYSRLMGSDEEGTLSVLKSDRRELINPLIAQHPGRIFKTTGDGILIEFASVVDAVRCAVVLQQGMEDRHANRPESERISFRPLAAASSSDRSRCGGMPRYGVASTTGLHHL